MKPAAAPVPHPPFCLILPALGQPCFSAAAEVSFSRRNLNFPEYPAPPPAGRRNGVCPMIKKHVIYKKDKWNMLTVEVNGKQLILREISDQWGEESRTFLSRPEMMHWVAERFPKEKFKDNPDEYEEIIAAFKQV
ncbi:hypothetical protein B2K_38980 [Paenibacillus mucilaginosus K02]|uniref:Uncharacterized protein n=2 Tax=Paenibacillus mucilaginosus TaxID=61624 RepID=R9UKY9_9BACL|nr:hypothetical protein B2K_38980 [Paenibacillus mucilaginosus K02]